MMSRWRTTTTGASNAAAAATQEQDATTSSSASSATAPKPSSSSGVSSSQSDPSSTKARLDEECGDSGPSSPPPGSTSHRNLSDRLQLSPASRTAITIRTMAGVGADDEEEEGDDNVRSEDEGVGGSDGGGSGPGPGPGPGPGHQSPGRPPPAPSWRFSVGAVVVGEDAAALAAEAAPVDEEANDGESGPLSGPAAEQEAVPEVELPEGLLADPVHLHSFVPDSSLFRPLWGTVRRCAGCGERLRTLFGGTSGGGNGNGGNGDASSGSDGQTVRCAACGVLAHRGCAFSSRSIKRRGTGDATTMPVCETNAPLVEALERKTSPSPSRRRRRRITSVNGGEETDAAADEDREGRAASGDDNGAKPPVSAGDAAPTTAPAAAEPTAFGGGGGGLGAPFQSLSRILQENVAAIFDGNKQKREEEDQEGDGDNGIKKDAKDPVIWKGESSVADRADAVKRDERVLAEIERRLSSGSDTSSSSKEDGDVEIVSKGKKDSSKEVEEEEESAKVSLALLDEARTDRPPAPPKPRSAIGSALDLVRTTQRTQSNVRIASVAGSIAGGVAGLAIAGPAGAMIGAKLFQTAGVLGVLIDGTMGVGVIVAGATMGGKVAENISSGERVLRIGGSKGKEAADGLVLVRPNVVVDPVWEDLTAEAKRSAPSHATGGGAFGFVANHRRKTAEMEHRDRLKKDADNIVSADEYEIPAEEKVVLLVSSGLNDRHSLPGHVHRCLVSEYFRRSKERRDEALKNPRSRDKRGDRIKEPLLALARDDPSDASDPDRIGGERCPYRAARRDCHGVIRHVTATLLEVRPAFASSPRLAERTAAAVEALVFGELYADVFGEISEECREADERLLKKIGSFEAEAQRRTDRRRRRRSASPVDGSEAAKAHGGEGDDRSPEDDDKEEAAPAPAPAPPPSSGVRSEDISVGALGALLRLPEATTPADKLALCVEFLECVSVHFSSPPASSSGESGGGDAPRPKAKPAGADNLLKMVCEHVLVAKVPRLNAELTFLEEFARDEQLLRGREGYALVTLQAALHYLNASDDLERDIFRHCGG